MSLLCCQGMILKLQRQCSMISPILRHGSNVRKFLSIQDPKLSHDAPIEPSQQNISDVKINESSSGMDIVKPFRGAATTQSLIATSPTLKYLLAIGVNISKLEEYEGAADMVHKLSLTDEIKRFVELFKSLGVDDIAPIINKHPLILGEKEQNLRHRMMYLSSQGFTKDQIVRIATKYPLWFCQTVDEVDGKLGALQLLFQLNKMEMRSFMTQHPRIIDAKPSTLKKVHFSLREEYGLKVQEIKQVIHLSPSVLGTSQSALKKRMNYLIDTMKIPKEQIVCFPAVLRHRVKRLKEKHELLRALGQAQYNPSLPGYVSLEDLCEDSTLNFCARHRISEDQYHDFLRTM